MNQQAQPIPNDDFVRRQQEFIGYRARTAGCLYCWSCENNYHPHMTLPNIDYCGHCWGFLNNEQLNLIEGTYNGMNSFDEVKNFLIITYPLHPNTCTNNDCTYNKIKNAHERGELCMNLAMGLGLVQQPVLNIQPIQPVQPNEPNEPNEPKPVQISEPKKKIKILKHVKINFKLSKITI